jgi:CHAT domain-containing protein
MSLWEVADLQTQYLMTRFYHYYTSGYKLNIAFNKAKQDLKKRYGTSGTRPHWASFIILDALH